MTTISDVKSAFSGVPNAHIDEVDANGLVAEVTVADNQAGQFFATLRENGYDYDAKRLGERLVAHIEVEGEGGLGPLFG